MKGLTLTQPWSFAIAFCGKSVENRDWSDRIADLNGLSSLTGELIAIHGGTAPKRGNNKGWRSLCQSIADIHRRLDGELPEAAAAELARRAAGSPLDASHFITPGIVAVASLWGVTRASRSVWATEGDLHLMLSEVVALPQPVQVRGAQGFWHVPSVVEEAVRAQLPQRREQPAQWGHLDGGEWLA
ncbi:hypothetical protein [Deinococcus arenicola]|uniref:Uncharacterized protein n=1 Tax=Deinococcus arenicola TaxID=2994950 RepID=A0ABU4DVJ8_9DEIO|nr:hypothetical protein [Deinococcus sp. ZS9-10]MDV6376467.1 hypothetical protein [Deinococcus sp. ZS9-10]